MAEPVSSIVTLTTVSLELIRRTAIFIREAQAIDSLIERLLNRLLDLRKLIKVVEASCKQARSGEDSPARYVKDALTRCHSRLESVDETVRALASRRSGTFLQRVALKIRSDRAKREIEEAIEDIDRLMDSIHKGIGCWNLVMTSAIDRRTSEAPPVQQATGIRAGMEQNAQDESISPISRTLSEAETVFDRDSTIQSRRTSTATHNSRTSVSSSSSLARPPYSTFCERSNSINPDVDSVKKDNDWVDFHVQIKKCGGDDAQIQAIKAALGQQPQGTNLANSRDSAQRSPLHLAAQRGDVKLAQILLQFSADVNAKDSRFYSVLDLAVENNKVDFVDFLLENGVDVTAISKPNRYRFEEIREELDLRKSKVEKNKKVRKADKRTRTGITT